MDWSVQSFKNGLSDMLSNQHMIQIAITNIISTLNLIYTLSKVRGRTEPEVASIYQEKRIVEMMEWLTLHPRLEHQRIHPKDVTRERYKKLSHQKTLREGSKDIYS